MGPGEDLPGNADAGTVHQGVDWDLPGPESPQHLCWGLREQLCSRGRRFWGKQSPARNCRSGGAQEPIAALGHLRWSHGERGDTVSLALARLMGTAQQSQGRAGTGISPGSSQQDPASLSAAPRHTGLCARRAHLCPRTARGQPQPRKAQRQLGRGKRRLN